MAYVWTNPWGAPEGAPHPRAHRRHHHASEPPRETAPQPAAAGAPPPAPAARREAAPATDDTAANAQLAPDAAATAPAAAQAAPDAAKGVPEPVAVPSPETLQAFQQMQDDHRKSEDSLLQRFEGFIQQKKDQVFSLFHYVFGGGEARAPEKTAEGAPRLEQGGETAEQRAQRLAWEASEKQAVAASQDGENQALVRRAQQEASQFDNPYDPTQNRRMYDAYTRLQAEEDAMKRRQAEEMSRLGIAGLPDPAVPGRTLSQFVDDGWASYDRLVASNRQAETNSPQGRQINAYVAWVLDHPYTPGWGGGMMA